MKNSEFRINRSSHLSLATGRSYGFTLIEFLVVMGVMAIIFSLGLFFSMDSYRGYSFRTERNLAVSMLQKARSLAIANINQLPHGVHVDTAGQKYVLFEGSTFNPGAATNIEVPFIATSLSHSGMNDVLFNQLDGSVAAPRTWTFSDATHSSSITQNSEGQISWTN